MDQLLPHDAKEIYHLPFIKTGYLHFADFPTHSRLSVFISALFRIHNETVNIWSHILAVIIGCVALIIYAVENKHTIIILWITTAIVGHLGSVTYHIGRCINPSKIRLWYKMDMTGIWILQIGSFGSCIYLAFQCHVFLQRFYMGLFGIISLVFVPLYLYEPIATKVPANIKLIIIMVSVGVNIIPFIHLFCILPTELGLSLVYHCLCLQYGLFAVAAIIWYYHIPERFAPGKFDIWCHSHQWWHVMMSVGSSMCLFTLHNFAEYHESMDLQPCIY